MPRQSKKKQREITVIDLSQVECLDCGKKYGDFTQALADHNEETTISHRIKPIKTSEKTGRVQRTGRGTDDELDAPSMASPTSSADPLAELMRRFPTLITPEVRELTRGVEELRTTELEMAKTNAKQPPIDFKNIPNFEDASKMNDKELAKAMIHSPGCLMGAISVERSKSVIFAKCETCGNSLTLSKR